MTAGSGWLILRRMRGDVNAPAKLPPTAAARAESPPTIELKPTPPAEVASEVTVRSDPPGAHVIVGDQDMGTTPQLLKLPLPFAITLTRPGYQPSQELIRSGGEITVKLKAAKRKRPQPSPRPLPKGLKPGLD
jgi:hypothetical protein